MKTPDSVCAIIVTYHPTMEMILGLAEVVDQSGHLVVVDNGSDAATLAELRAASSRLSFTLLEQQRNLGIAEALNVGVRWALGQDWTWLLLLDQDSQLTAGFTQNMLSTWSLHPEQERIGSLHPTYIDPESGTPSFVLRASDGGPVKSMTSGALMPSWIFERIGYFASEYFIDEVDTEYCWRIRAKGLLVADSSKAQLVHQVGHPTNERILGFSFRPTNHGELRRYYMSRNRVVLYRAYFRIFPRWVLYSMWESGKETLKCLLGEKHRLLKLRAIALGLRDAATGRMGPRSEQR